MLNSLYDILGLFEDAFERAGSVAGLIQVDASGETRYAEGTTKEGTPWHIESDFSNSTLQDSDQLRLGYAQLGDLLLVPFYESAKAKFNNSGWTVTHIETHVQKVMEPVLNAMRFNMGLAATRGWLQDQFSYDPLGNTREKAPFTLDQVVSWTQLGIPGRWSSMELMSMLIDLEQGGHYLDYVSGKKWIASHQKKCQNVAKRMLDAVFSPNKSKRQAIQTDSVQAVHAWKSWWMQMSPDNMSNTPLIQLDNFSQKKSESMVEGWYLRVAQSKEIAKRSLVGIQHSYHEFPTKRSWEAFCNTLAVVVNLHPSLVWKDREVQAWLLHRAIEQKINLHLFVAMTNNRVHDYLTVGYSLDSSRLVHELYPLWCQIQEDVLKEPLLTTVGLFDDGHAMAANVF